MSMTLPFLDFKADGFSTRSDAVYNARDASWVAETPFGLCVLRHREAGLLLRHKSLRQGSYSWPRKNGLTGSFTDFWERSVISQEGEPHKAIRTLMISALAPDLIEGMKDAFRASAISLLDAVADAGEMEFMADFSVPFAGQAICTLLGLPKSDWPRISEDASDLGLAMGLDCAGHAARVNAACDRLMALAGELVAKARSGAARRNFITALVAGFDAQNALNEQALLDMIVIAIFGGVDTTRAQLGLMMRLFDEHPEQWALLHGDPTLAGNAVEEAIRNHPTTTWATREAVEDFVFQDVEIVAGKTVHILSHATGTDPAIHTGARFDITATRKTHFGFGGGAHHCIGHLVARTDMGEAVGVLARRIKRFEILEGAAFLPDSGNTSPVTLPLRFETN